MCPKPVTIKDFIMLKVAANRLTYQQLQRMYTPEELEKLYGREELSEALPARPEGFEEMLSPLQKITNMPQMLQPYANFLQHGWGQKVPDINLPSELIGGR